MNSKKIGHFILELRKKQKLTQEDLAKKLCIDRGTISKWERGVYVPNPDDLLVLSKIFNVSVNEILLGEKENKNNREEINLITIDVLKKNKKIKKYLISSLVIILILIILFLLSYFLVNYNSIKVYTIVGESENFVTNDGIMIVSDEQSYLKIGEIESKNDEEINFINIFYMKNDKKYLIAGYELEKGDSNSILLINLFGYEDLFPYEDLKYIKDSLFIEVSYDDNKKESIDLTLTKDFSNNNIFPKRYTSISDEEHTEYVEEEEFIPKYVKDNFEWNADERNYFLEETKDGKKIKQVYAPSTNWYVVYEGSCFYDYSFNFNSLEISYVDNSDIRFEYDFDEDKCSKGECDMEKVEYFRERYLNNLK